MVLVKIERPRLKVGFAYAKYARRGWRSRSWYSVFFSLVFASSFSIFVIASGGRSAWRSFRKNLAGRFPTLIVSRSIYPNRRFHKYRQSYNLFRRLTTKIPTRQPLHHCQPLLSTVGPNQSQIDPWDYEIPYHHGSRHGPEKGASLVFDGLRRMALTCGLPSTTGGKWLAGA